MVSQKIPHIFPMEYNICNDKLPHVQLLLYISYEQRDLYMLVTTKAFLVPITMHAKVNTIDFNEGV